MFCWINFHISGKFASTKESQIPCQISIIYDIVNVNKGIRDAGSTADFRILFEILKIKIWKFENLENFGTFGKL